MGYNAPVDHADVSNANTPGDIDPTSADPGAYYRVVGELGENGTFQFTETNAFSRRQRSGGDLERRAGRATSSTPPATPATAPTRSRQRRHRRRRAAHPAVEPARSPRRPRASRRRSGSFNVAQLGDAADKAAKDNNYRGMTDLQQRPLLHEGQRGQRRRHRLLRRHRPAAPARRPASACPSRARRCRPTSTLTYDADRGAAPGKKPSTRVSTPQNMCILKGFPTSLATKRHRRERLPLRHLVRQPDHALRRRRGRR